MNMPMRQTLLISSALVGLALAPIALSQRTSRAELRFQEAHRKETIDGDLKSAIDLYRRAIAEAGSNRPIAAQALVRMGECYEKLGDADARKAYERVVRDFGDQKDLAETARTRLTAMGRAGGIGHPTGITLRKVWAVDRGELTGSPSPDGRYFSFTDWETGDLAVRDLVTGQNRRLTNKGTREDSDEYANASVISGDGRQIAYTWYNKEKGWELRLCGFDGSNPRTVYCDKEFGDYIEPYQWTADGKQILAALSKQGTPKETRIALIPAAGGPARILPTRALIPWFPSLSPDGRFVVYSASAGADIFVLSLEGGQEAPLVPSGYGGWLPIWMPDGKRVLFISGRTGANGFWAIEVVEGKPVGIPHLLRDNVGSVVRPKGFTRRGDLYYSRNSNIADVYVAELDLAAGKIVRQPVPAARRLVGSHSGPSWSPDGRRLAYYSREEPDEPPKLMILSVETREARKVPVKLDGQFGGALWLPDGKSVFVTTRGTPKRDLNTNYRVDLQTGDHLFVRSFPVPVPGAGDISPDGKTHFFFTGGEPKLRGGVISCDIETQQEREIARVPDLAEGGFPKLTVSPDSKVLALRAPVDGNQWTAIRLMPAAGGEWRELCRFPKSETDGSWDLRWTPDGRNLLILRRAGKDGIPELWRIPVAGGEPQRTGLSMEGMGLFSIHPDGRRIAFESGSRSRKPNELWVLENLPAAAK
jgi:Tol biopolymer transport system component